MNSIKKYNLLLMKLITIIILNFTFIFFSACNQVSSIQVYDLKCENLKNPLGIDKTTPRLSWKVRGGVNGTEQKAFQVLISSDSSLLSKDKADLWDSGKVNSSEGILVPYKGQKLSSGSVAYWKIRIYNEKNEVSPWSPISSFVVGLIDESDWKASYIGFNIDAGYFECPQVYKSFEIKEKEAHYFLHVNSLGYHEVYLNGVKVGKGVLTPAACQYGKRSLSITYDLSPFIKKGENDLMLWLGSGWYTEGLFEKVNSGPLVKAQLEKITDNNSKEIILTTNQTWLGRNSSYQREGNWRPYQFGGEVLHGSLTKTDLSTANTEGRIWEPVTVASVLDHKVTPQMVEKNEIIDTISPVAIDQITEDVFIVDMGQNITGWLEMNFHDLPKSHEIVIEYFDNLDDSTSFAPPDKYIASGEEPEVFINKFNYHGFRYLKISNLLEIPQRNSINGYLIHTDYEMSSGFKCSDSDLNKIHDMVVYTLRCVSLGGVLVDCPHRERLGYGGDGNASTIAAQTIFNLAPMYTNWFQAWADVIHDDGSMPHTAPNVNNAGGGPYWCGFIITASWNTFVNYGDTLMLRKNYPVMQKWLEYVDKYTVDGLLKRWPDTPYRAWYLGDWASPEGVDHTATKSVDLVNNSFMVVCYDYLQKIARILGKKEDIEYYAEKENKLKKKINEFFFKPDSNIYGTGTQIDLVFPLYADIVPEDLIDEVTKSLEYETLVNHNGHIASGLVGLSVLIEWAIKKRAYDLVYTILKKREYPGYLYMIDNGATTTWEHWNAFSSRIHNCYNGVGQWFYQAIGGINPIEEFPAYRKVRIDPQIPDGIQWAKAYKETPFGKLDVSWEIEKEIMKMTIDIPVGIEALVVIPIDVKNCILNGQEHNFQRGEPNVLKIKSGKYNISYDL